MGWHFQARRALTSQSMGPLQIQIAPLAFDHALESEPLHRVVLRGLELPRDVVEHGLDVRGVLPAGVLAEVPLEAGDQIAVNRIHPGRAFANAPNVVEPRRDGLRHPADETVVEKEGPQTFVDRNAVGPGPEGLKQARLPGGHQELLSHFYAPKSP